MLNLQLRYFRQQNKKIAKALMSRISTLVAVEETWAMPSSEDVRLRAPGRLYLRRDAVLIRSLEAYQRTESCKAPYIPINVGRWCW